MIKPLYDVRYEMQLGGGYDVWRIFGTDHRGERICPSTPVAYDEQSRVIETSSGSKYRIETFKGTEREFTKQILKDIEHRGYERH